MSQVCQVKLVKTDLTVSFFHKGHGAQGPSDTCTPNTRVEGNDWKQPQSRRQAGESPLLQEEKAAATKHHWLSMAGTEGQREEARRKIKLLCFIRHI